MMGPDYHVPGDTTLTIVSMPNGKVATRPVEGRFELLFRLVRHKKRPK